MATSGVKGLIFYRELAWASTPGACLLKINEFVYEASDVTNLINEQVNDSVVICGFRPGVDSIRAM